MEILFWNFGITLVYCVLIYLMLFTRKTGIGIGAFAFGLILMLANPFRFTEEGGESLERNISRFDDIPAKVVIKQESYKDLQERELNSLKQQSEDMKDEIHN